MSTVVITGIGKGIGKALAEKFVAEGYTVIGTTHLGEAAIAGVQAYKLDLADSKSIEDAARDIRAAAPMLDIMINNAGVLLDEDETSLDPELLRKTLEVNVIGTAAFTKALTESIVASGGHIVNISSTAGSLALAGGSASHFPLHYPAYKISKAALNMYTRTLATELKGKVIVSSVHPGWVQTDMGGEEADITPAEAAEGIFNVAISKPETGQFWFKGKKLPW